MARNQYDADDFVRQRMDQMAVDFRDEIYRYALTTLTKGHAEVAEDLVQDTFIQAQVYLLAHPDKQIATPLAWLKKIAYHRFLNTNRRKLDKNTTSLEQMCCSQTREDDTSPIEFQGPSEDEPEHIIEATEDEQEGNDSKKKAIIAMDVDDEAKQIAIEIIKGLSYIEIAYKRGMTVAQVKSYIKSRFNGLQRK